MLFVALWLGGRLRFVGSGKMPVAHEDAKNHDLPAIDCGTICSSELVDLVEAIGVGGGRYLNGADRPSQM